MITVDISSLSRREQKLFAAVTEAVGEIFREDGQPLDMVADVMPLAAIAAVRLFPRLRPNAQMALCRAVLSFLDGALQTARRPAEGRA